MFVLNKPAPLFWGSKIPAILPIPLEAILVLADSIACLLVNAELRTAASKALMFPKSYCALTLKSGMLCHLLYFTIIVLEEICSLFSLPVLVPYLI
jgi:hypothetical protein